MSSSLYNLLVYGYSFHYLALLLCAIYHLDQELDDETEIVMISDSCFPLLMPDHNVTLITGYVFVMCVCVCVYMSEHVFTRLYACLLCIAALHYL